MQTYTKALLTHIETQFGALVLRQETALGQLTIEIDPRELRRVASQLRDHEGFQYDVLLDVCGVDYLHYGHAEWKTEQTTATGFSRGVQRVPAGEQPQSQERASSTTDRFLPSSCSRYAVVYHFLSVTYNHRLRLRTFLPGENPSVASLTDIWPSANWFEREAYDLLGIEFTGHPDLRRILTDYGFQGHPFRKDFPLIGEVEMRYDAAQQACVYDPVSIKPRVLVPKVIR